MISELWISKDLEASDRNLFLRGGSEKTHEDP
jgi:hypothetical protein